MEISEERTTLDAHRIAWMVTINGSWEGNRMNHLQLGIERLNNENNTDGRQMDVMIEPTGHAWCLGTDLPP